MHIESPKTLPSSSFIKATLFALTVAWGTPTLAQTPSPPTTPSTPQSPEAPVLDEPQAGQPGGGPPPARPLPAEVTPEPTPAAAQPQRQVSPPRRRAPVQRPKRRASRVLEWQRPAALFFVSVNQRLDAVDDQEREASGRVGFLLQPFALWQRSARLGLVVDLESSDMRFLLGGQNWLNDHVNVYAQMLAGWSSLSTPCVPDMPCENSSASVFTASAEGGMSVYLGSAMNFYAYVGGDMDRGAYAGVGMGIAWWALMRAGWRL